MTNKQVKFDAHHDKDPKTDRTEEGEICPEYLGKFGKIDKFIKNNSPIDRYYKMYVIEPNSKVFGKVGAAANSPS